MGRIRTRRWVALGVATAMVFAFAFVLAGCGEKLVEEKIEQEMEDALGVEGADVDIDVDGDDSGSIKITGDDGDSEIAFGDAAAVPEDFPKDLVPGDAEVLSAATVDQGGDAMQSVAFTSGTGLDDMYAWYLDALPKAGYTIENKMQFDSGGSKGFNIVGTGTADDCNVTGADQDGEFMYSVMIIAH